MAEHEKSHPKEEAEKPKFGKKVEKMKKTFQKFEQGLGQASEKDLSLLKNFGKSMSGLVNKGKVGTKDVFYSLKDEKVTPKQFWDHQAKVLKKQFRDGEKKMKNISKLFKNGLLMEVQKAGRLLKKKLQQARKVGIVSSREHLVDARDAAKKIIKDTKKKISELGKKYRSGIKHLKHKKKRAVHHSKIRAVHHSKKRAVHRTRTVTRRVVHHYITRRVVHHRVVHHMRRRTRKTHHSAKRLSQGHKSSAKRLMKKGKKEMKHTLQGAKHQLKKLLQGGKKLVEKAKKHLHHRHNHKHHHHPKQPAVKPMAVNLTKSKPKPKPACRVVTDQSPGQKPGKCGPIAGGAVCVDGYCSKWGWCGFGPAWKNNPWEGAYDSNSPNKKCQAVKKLAQAESPSESNITKLSAPAKKFMRVLSQTFSKPTMKSTIHHLIKTWLASIKHQKSYSKVDYR